MAGSDQPADQDEPLPADDVLDDNPKSFLKGYMHGLSEFLIALQTHGPFYYSAIYDHCSSFYDELLRWQNNADDDLPPPSVPPFTKP